MPRMKLLLLLAMLFTSWTVFATSQGIGLIMIQRGGSVVIRGNQTLPTKVGLTILEKDQIQTDTDSYLKIVMKDRNVLVITGGSQITLENYSIKKMFRSNWIKDLSDISYKKIMMVKSENTKSRLQPL